MPNVDYGPLSVNAFRPYGGNFPASAHRLHRFPLAGGYGGIPATRGGALPRPWIPWTDAGRGRSSAITPPRRQLQAGLACHLGRVLLPVAVNRHRTLGAR